MQDRDVVSAVVAGEADGIAEMYDRYAASLYAYCHSMLPRPEAAEVVRDTFLIAVSRLDGLHDRDRLDAWLHAVARNECLRRLGPAGVGTAAALVSRSADPDELPAVTLPAELRGQVLTACADNSPTGRAHRVSVTHRAGAFGPSGFPKAIGPAGPRWWQRFRRHPPLVAAVAVMAVVAVAAGITVIMTASGSQRTQASALRLGGGLSGVSSSATPGGVNATPSPTDKATPTPSPTVPSVTMRAGAPSPVPPSVTMTKKPSASPSQSSASPSQSSASPSPSPSPSPSTSPAQGHLLAAPTKLVLTAASGKAARGLFVLTAAGGPVSHYTITVPVAMAGKVAVSPAMGSLPAGGFVAVTVTVTSTVALSTHVTVGPGNLTINVTLTIKA